MIGSSNSIRTPTLARRALCIAAALTAGSITWSAAAFAPTQGVNGAEAPLSARQRDEVSYHAFVLARADAPPAVRREAALRLLQLNLPAGLAIIEEGLRGSDSDLRLSILAALEAIDRPPVAMLEAMLGSLSRAEPTQIDRIGLIISRFGEAGLARVAAITLDADLDLTLRLRAAQTLSFFRGADTAQKAVDTLMQVIDPARREPREMVEVGYNSLRRLTNLRFGQNNHQFWSAWWERNRNQPVTEWLPSEVQEAAQQVALLVNRVEELEKRLAALEVTAEARRKRLEEAIAQLYGIFSDRSHEEKLNALAGWLDEPLATVRRYAMQRADGLIRNSEAVNETLVTRIIGRLKDPERDLRLLAAQLLDRLNHAQAGALVTQALAVETDPENITRFLDIIARRPVPEAVPVALGLINDPARSNAAARVLTAAVERNLVTDEQHALIAREAERLFAANPSGSAIRLFGLLADDEDVQQLVPLLAHQQESTRRAAAEVLSTRSSAAEALLAHAGDPVVFPSAVQMLIARGGITAFQSLLDIDPPADTLRDGWLTALRTLALPLAPNELLQADDLLTRTPETRLDLAARRTLREAILAPIATLPPGDITPAHGPLLTRLAQVRAALHRPEGVLEALNRLNGHSTQPEHQSLRFEALLHLARYDDAARIHQDPATWILALTRLIDHRRDAAIALAREIDRRFPDLTDDSRADLDAARARLGLNGNAGEQADPPSV